MTPSEAILPFFEPAAVSSSGLSAGLRALLDARLQDDSVTCVLLGEATHGSHEFFLLRHQISQYLIEAHGFRTIALEASWFRTRWLNQFLADERPFSDDLAGQLYYWIWHTKEMTDFLVWLKHYRQQTGRPVSIHGIDFWHSQGVIPALLKILRRYRLTVSRSFVQNLSDLYTHDDSSGQQASAAYQQLHDPLTALQQLLQSHPDRLPPSQLVLSLRYIQIVRQLVAYLSHPEGSVRAYLERDFFLAENVRYLQNSAATNEKIIVWAHNIHIADIRQAGQPLSMGAHLASEAQAACLSLGFLFGRGGFQALQPGQASHERRVYTVEKPLPDSYEAHFAALNLSAGLLHLDQIASSSQRIAAWWAKARRFWSIGAAFSPSHLHRSSTCYSLPGAFSKAVYLPDVRPSNLTVPTG